MKLQSVIIVVCVVLFSSLAFGTRPDTSYKESPLHFAAYRGDLSAVKALVKGGADFNEIGKRSGKTPLHLARDVSVITLLVRTGAEVGARDKWGRTPLEITRLLIGAGAKANVRNSEGATPLHMGIYGNPHDAARFSTNPSIVEALLDSGADPAAKDGYGETPRNYAKRHSSLKATGAFRRLKVAVDKQ